MEVVFHTILPLSSVASVTICGDVTPNLRDTVLQSPLWTCVDNHLSSLGTFTSFALNLDFPGSPTPPAPHLCQAFVREMLHHVSHKCSKSFNVRLQSSVFTPYSEGTGNVTVLTWEPRYGYEYDAFQFDY